MASSSGARLEDQAATAALTASKGNKKQAINPLGPDGKLSAASAATSLKHADAQDLPAFPVVGVQNTGRSAGTAANLAERNKTKFEHWKPGEIPAANKAALLAKDYKMDPLWRPDLSAAGSRAALLAAKNGGNVDIWLPESTDAGHSAAELAMRRQKATSGSENPGSGKKALNAATGAVDQTRQRADSTPASAPAYPDAANSAANALKAAKSANSTKGAVQSPGKHNAQSITNMQPSMYGSQPLIGPELDEQKRQAGLRAAAVSMAQKMYDVQQKQLEAVAQASTTDSHRAAGKASDRPQSVMTSNDTTGSPYINLQETATRLAAERLAKLHDENAAYRSYYGTQASPASRLSLRSRRRAASDSHGAQSDEENSRQIRNQMSLMTDSLAMIDHQKRQKDRDSLMAAAQRNVRASMTAQDQRLFQETGKITPSMKEDWESKARVRAQADSDARLANHGMVSIGGGKFLDQSEIEAIAAAKVQPTLDAITLTAEEQRARDEELRLQQLEREQLHAERVADDRERSALAKEEWRRFKDEEKREEKNRKLEAKTRKHQEKQLRSQEKHQSKLPEVVVVSKPQEQVSNDAKAADQPLAKSSFADEPSVQPSMRSADEPANGIAQRVFAAPVLNETVESRASGERAMESSQAAAETSNTDMAPVVQQTEVGTVHDDNKSMPLQAPPNAGKQPDKSLAARIAPTIASPSAKPKPSSSTTTEAKAKNDKESKRVSSWLKTFRRSSKGSAARPVISSPQDSRVLPGDSELSDSKTAVPTHSAGTGASTSALSAPEPPPLPADTATAPSTGQALPNPSSSSISSLSSGENHRGRSTTRLADIPIQSRGGIVADPLHAHPTEQVIQEPAEKEVMTESSAYAQPATSAAADAEGGLYPPDNKFLDAVQRQGESPARDSKFVEAL